MDEVEVLLEARTGLVFPGSRRALLERAIATWLDEMSLSVGTAALRVLEQPDRTAWHRLVTLATVGETYFFRHREQLNAFCRIALPLVVEARRGLQAPVLRAWSAGCSSGEEAYSLAMLLDEALPDRARWQVRVVGTDIDEEALERARTGVYGRWAFRAEGGRRSRWFCPVPGGEQIEPRIQDLVTFEAHNLADPRAARPAALGGPADLVVCRNVTIYMSPDARRSVAAHLYDALAPGGWLLVGPAEPSAETYQRFIPHVIDGITLYQRPFDEPSAHLVRPTGADTANRRGAAPPAAAPPAAAPPAVRPRLANSAPRVAVTDPRSLLEEARALADAGHLDEAQARCRLALERDRRLPLGYVLLATIAEARDDLAGACHALGRAAYLEPGDPVTQFRLGLLEWRCGRTTKAGARLRAAMVLIDGLPDERLLDGHAGLTVGRVRRVAMTLLV
ncbi:MAG: CheR family methyltransferase [Chloroflexota bacterium]